MKEKFDFDSIGHASPYRIPEGFFEQLTRHTVEEALRRQKLKRKRFVWRWATAVSAAAAVVLSFWLFHPENTAPPLPTTNVPSLIASTAAQHMTTVRPQATAPASPNGTAAPQNSVHKTTAMTQEATEDPSIEQLTDEELNAWVEMAQSDPFLTTNETIEEP